MTTSLTPSLSELFEDGKRIPEETLEFLRERLRGMLHQLVRKEFLAQSRAKGLQQKDLADKLDKHPEQISRWLKRSGNREVDTVSDLLAAMGIIPVRVEVARAIDLVAAEAAGADYDEPSRRPKFQLMDEDEGAYTNPPEHENASWSDSRPPETVEAHI